MYLKYAKDSCLTKKLIIANEKYCISTTTAKIVPRFFCPCNRMFTRAPRCICGLYEGIISEEEAASMKVGETFTYTIEQGKSVDITPTEQGFKADLYGETYEEMGLKPLIEKLQQVEQEDMEL